MNNARCSICNYTTTTIEEYLLHIRYHSTYSNYTCGVNNCKASFKSLHTLKTHIFKYHLSVQTSNNPFSTYDCSIATCRRIISSGKELISHLRTHIDSGIDILCPIVNCDKIFSNKSTFSSHLSRKHYNQIDSKPNSAVPIILVSNSKELETSSEETLVLPAPALCVDGNITNAEEQLLKNTALFFLKLQSKFLIPSSTVDSISSELINLTFLNNHLLEHKIRLKFSADIQSAVVNLSI